MSWDNSVGAWLSRIMGGPILGTYQFIKDLKNQSYNESERYSSRVASGEITAEEALGAMASGGVKMSPEVETYLNNMLANQRTNEARDYETQMANTDLLRAASQLGALGLSPSNVLSTGGSATPNVGAAGVMNSNNANARLEREKSVANAMIGMAGRMASSGIYGSAMTAVKEAGAKAAAAAAHTAKITKFDSSSGYSWLKHEEYL